MRSTREKWIDGVALALTILYQFLFGKPVTFWQGAEPFVWLLCAIALVHATKATCEVWHEISTQPTIREVESPILLPNATRSKKQILVPRLPYFRQTLAGALLLSLAILSLFCYVAHRAARASIRTTIYLAASAELIECQSRAFFVEMNGPQIRRNVEIALKDNKSGQMYIQTYPEIDPGPRSTDIHFLFVPSSPWDEDYTVTVVTSESRSSQRLIVRSVQNQPQFAMEISTDNEREPALRCRDALLPESYNVAAGEHRPCSELMKLAEDAPSKLDAFNYQRADGALTVRRMKSLPSPSELDQQSDDRHITEYQHQIIEPVLRKYSRSHILVYFAGGKNSKKYAEEFAKMFNTLKWVVKGPTMAPKGDERIIDIQLSANYAENWNKFNPKPHDILNAFSNAGVKQRSTLALDPNVPSDCVVLWVGPRSPSAIKSDQCLAPEMKPVEGQGHACEMISQAAGVCRFPPK